MFNLHILKILLSILLSIFLSIFFIIFKLLYIIFFTINSIWSIYFNKPFKFLIWYDFIIVIDKLFKKNLPTFMLEIVLLSIKIIFRSYYLFTKYVENRYYTRNDLYIICVLHIFITCLYIIYHILSIFFENKFRKFYTYIFWCLGNSIDTFVDYRNLLFRYLSIDNRKFTSKLFNLLLFIIYFIFLLLYVYLILKCLLFIFLQYLHLFF